MAATEALALPENRAETGQWLRGVSGNPGGRPRGLADLVRRETKDGAELVEFFLAIFRGKRKAPLRQRIEAATWLADRGFGKALQQMELSGPDSEPLTIRVEYAETLPDADENRSPV